MRIRCTKKSSKTIWKRLNKLEPRWLTDSTRSKFREKQRDNNKSNKLLIENSKWKLMISERKKLSSWLLVATLKERSSSWIRRPNLNKQLLKNKSTLNFGCSITIKKSTEKRLRQLKRRRKFTRPSISLPGRTKIK